MILGHGIPTLNFPIHLDTRDVYPLIRGMFLSGELSDADVNRVMRDCPDFKEWWKKQ